MRFLPDLSVLDLFRAPVVLTFEKREKTTTIFGILFSVGLMIFLVVDFFKNDVFLHESPTVEIVEPIQEKRPVINYNDKIFTVAIEMTLPMPTMISDFRSSNE